MSVAQLGGRRRARRPGPLLLAAAVTLLAAMLPASPALAIAVPADTTLNRLRASFGERGRVRLRIEGRWRERDHVTVDSAGVSFVSGAMSGTRIRASLQPDERTPTLVPWGAIESVQVPNPDARPGTLMLVTLVLSATASVLLPQNADFSLIQTLVFSACVTTGSMVAATALTGGPHHEWRQAYPPEPAGKN